MAASQSMPMAAPREAAVNRWLIPVGAVVVQSSLPDVHHRAGSSGIERRFWRPVGGAPRTARSRDRRRDLLWRWVADWRHRPGGATECAGIPGHGSDRRNWMRIGLHLSRQHSGEMVSGPPRDGHRHGDHGLRRWSLPGWLSERLLYGIARHCEDHDGSGRRLSGDYADRREYSAPSP